MSRDCRLLIPPAFPITPIVVGPRGTHPRFPRCRRPVPGRPVLRLPLKFGPGRRVARRAWRVLLGPHLGLTPRRVGGLVLLDWFPWVTAVFLHDRFGQLQLSVPRRRQGRGGVTFAAWFGSGRGGQGPRRPPFPRLMCFMRLLILPIRPGVYGRCKPSLGLPFRRPPWRTPWSPRPVPRFTRLSPLTRFIIRNNKA